jgi:hypothetical protein
MANQQAKIDGNYQKTLLAKDALTGETRPVLVDNASGRMLTASVVAPDSGSGITQINADASTSQTLATGTSGTDFNIATASGTHTFNIPTASATNRGLLSTTDWSDFNSKQDALTAGEGVDLTGGTLSIDYATFDESSIDASNITLSDLDFSTITASQLGNIDHDQLLNYNATEHFTQTDIVQVGTVTSGTWQAGAIQEEYGGTGQSTYTKGDILYSDASNSLAKLPIGTDGQQLRVTSTGELEWFNSSTSSASTTTEGVVELATNAEAESKVDTTKAVTPSNLGAIFLDEDDMASDSATKLASQQSIKAYSDSGTQALTNKTINADNNNISNLAHGSEVDNPTSGVHGVTGSVVGTSDAQTLTNKTLGLTSNTISGTTAEFNTALSDGDFTTLSGTETLTNKTLDTPVINNPSGLSSGDLSDFIDNSGSSGHVKLGNLMIQWGETGVLTTVNSLSGTNLYSSADASVSFAVAFKVGTTPKVSLGLNGSSKTSWANMSSPDNTGFTANLLSGNSSDSSVITWIAIGTHQ